MSTSGQQQPSGGGAPRPKWVRILGDGLVREVVEWTDDGRPVVTSPSTSIGPLALTPGTWEAVGPEAPEPKWVVVDGGPVFGTQVRKVLRWTTAGGTLFPVVRGAGGKEVLVESDWGLTSEPAARSARGGKVAGGDARSALLDAIVAYGALCRDATDGGIAARGTALVEIGEFIDAVVAEGRGTADEKAISELVSDATPRRVMLDALCRINLSSKTSIGSAAERLDDGRIARLTIAQRLDECGRIARLAIAQARDGGAPGSALAAARAEFVLAEGEMALLVRDTKRLPPGKEHDALWARALAEVKAAASRQRLADEALTAAEREEAGRG